MQRRGEAIMSKTVLTILAVTSTACSLLGATGAASATTYTLSLTQSSGTLVGPFLSLNSAGSNSADFSQPIDRLTPVIFQDLELGKTVELDFTEEVSPSIFTTFAFHDVLFADAAFTSAPNGEEDVDVSFRFLTETTTGLRLPFPHRAETLISTNATPLPAALPLFGTGLGGLGLLGWRRKRKSRGAVS
jgi:hypothetical protein